MHAEVIDNHLVRIRKDLARKGLTYAHLQDDILDHICCMVEEELDSGKDFESSYGEIMSSIGDETLPSLQHQTLLLIDKKFQKMKKTAYILGLLGSILAIVGSVFKMMHWPGASILLTLGFVIVVLGFLPMYFILSFREQVEKPKVIFPLVGYISLLLIFTGAVFKIMHWPGAGILLKASTVFLLVGFLPLYIVQIFKRVSGKKINMAYIIMLLVGISIVMILARVNLSKDAIDKYTDLTLDYSEASGLLSREIYSTLEMVEDSMITGDVEKIIKYADELVSTADEMLAGLLETVDAYGTPINEVPRRDYRNGGREAFLDNGSGEEFLRMSREYKSFLLSVVDDPLVKSQVNIDLLFSIGDWTTGWDPSDYAYDPLIINYSKITTFKYSVLNAEYRVLRNLLEE